MLDCESRLGGVGCCSESAKQDASFGGDFNLGGDEHNVYLVFEPT
jgi:hypothetical protein